MGRQVEQARDRAPRGRDGASKPETLEGRDAGVPRVGRQVEQARHRAPRGRDGASKPDTLAWVVRVSAGRRTSRGRRTPRATVWRMSRSVSRVNPSKSRLPPPRTTGAVEIASSSTAPASRPCRIRSAPPPRETSLPSACARAAASAASKPSTNSNRGRGVRLVLDPVGEHDERAREGVGAAPRAGGVVHPAADDAGAEAGGECVVEGAVGLTHLGGVLAVVGPWPAHDPVVQPLAAGPEPVAGAVVGSGDVAVERHGDGGDDLAHGSSRWVPAASTDHGGTPELIAALSSTALELLPFER